MRAVANCRSRPSECKHHLAGVIGISAVAVANGTGGRGNPRLPQSTTNRREDNLACSAQGVIMTSVAHAWCARSALFVTLVTVCYAGPPKPYGELFQLGKEAYLEEDYQSCASILLDAIEQHKQFQQLLLDCREKCESQAAAETLLTSVDADVQLHVFERLIRETHCLVQCQKQRLGAQLENYLDSGWADEDFRLRKPYEYLQLCFFKVRNANRKAKCSQDFNYIINSCYLFKTPGFENICT